MTTPSAGPQTLPRTVSPMLARLARQPFDSADHIYELKWDGIRALAFVDGSNLRLLSRSSRDLTSAFPELADLPKQVRVDRTILDGELVCLDDLGHPRYDLLQDRLHRPRTSESGANPVHFIAFDLLYLHGRSLMKEPLVDRKGLLGHALAPSELSLACDFIEKDGKAFFQATCDLGLEGIVAKDRSSLYFPGMRSQHWLKIKRIRESAFVVGGYTFGGTRKEFFSSLLLGLYDNQKRLIFVGQISTGISKAVAEELSPDLERISCAECPFETLPNIQKFIFWCRPELVCQVEYGEFTEDGKLAYPVFKALRDDKTGAECLVADAIGWPRALADYA